MRTVYQRSSIGIGRRCPATVPARQHRPRIRLRISAVGSGVAAPPAQNGGSAASAAAFVGGLPKAFIDWWKVEMPGKEKQPEAPIKLGPVLSKLWGLCAPDVPLLVLASGFMVVASLCELAIPHYATKSIFAASEGSTAFHGFLKILTCMVAAYGIGAALRGFCFSILNNRMTRRLRTELFASLAARETAFFDGEDVGNLTSRLQADCQAMTKVIATNANIAIRNGLQAIGGIAYLYTLSPLLCAITVAISATLWAVTLVYGNFARRMQKIFQDVLAESNTVAEEALTLSRVVRTFGTEAVETKRYSSWLDRLYEVGKRQAAGYSLFVATGHIACYASKVAALAVGCGMVLRGMLTAEQLTNFIMYVEFVTYASLNVCDEFTEICEAVGASERVVAMLGAPPAPQIATGAAPTSFSGRLDLKDVRFSYPSRPGNLALAGVNLSFAPGKLTALVGLSGSGKTTVCGLLQRLYDPDGGALLLDGTTDLRTVDAAWYRQQIGVVPQEPRLFSRSIAANIAYGMEHDPPSPEEVREAAAAANAHDFIAALPQGYDTPVTDKLLSGGQKQRLALARALVRKPKLLVLDEFSSALDAESEAQVHAALDRAMADRQRTVVVIAHRLSTVRHADVIVVMDKGKVAEQGSHHELLAQRGIYWQLVCRQQYGIDPNAALATDTDSESILSAAAAAAAAADGVLGNGNGIGRHASVAVAAAVHTAAATNGASNGSGGNATHGSLSSSAASTTDPWVRGSMDSYGSLASLDSGSLEQLLEPLGGGEENLGLLGPGGVMMDPVSEEAPLLDGAGSGSGSGAQQEDEASDATAAAEATHGSAHTPPHAPHAASASSLSSLAGSMASMGTMEEEGDVDEAGRPAAAAAAGAGRMSAVLAGVVVRCGAEGEGRG